MAKTPDITPELLRRVHLDNVRDHQIGGLTDGITEESAGDIGFESAEQTEGIIHTFTDRPHPWDVTLHERVVAAGGLDQARKQLDSHKN